MLKTFEAVGINGHIDVPKTKFNPDLNLITGKNGSGKTTILKLIWYLISGNLERIIQEMTFSYVRIRTTDFSIALDRRADPEKVELRYESRHQKTLEKFGVTEFGNEPPALREINHVSAGIRASVFFPTFRRIEGGFSIGSRSAFGQARASGVFRSSFSAVDTALRELSERLSVGDHRFVCSISTDDVVTLLTSRYAQISQRTNSEQTKLVRSIIKEIESQATFDPASITKTEIDEVGLLISAYEAIANIRKMTTDYGELQAQLLTPFSTLSDFIKSIFVDKGITITPGIDLGIDKGKVPSELLSAGEKQILSFLVYNAFSSKIPIFIDEPEISLHVDWQRILFQTLLRQAAGNQFIVATHSPFIYSRFSDNEIPLLPGPSQDQSIS